MTCLSWFGLRREILGIEVRDFGMEERVEMDGVLISRC